MKVRIDQAPVFCLFGFALVVGYLKAPTPPPARFAAPQTVARPTTSAGLQRELLFAAAPSAHASSLTELSDGRIAAAWYAGAYEGAEGVRIWFSTKDGMGWTNPRVIADGVTTIAATRIGARTLGNPIIHFQSRRLHLWYVSVAFGGWSVSSINHSVSDDLGETWSAPRKLVTSPFFNISTLVRARPVALEGDEIGLPVYHELAAKRAEWLRLDSEGRVLGKVRIPSERAALQPAVAPIDATRAIALMRASAGRLIVANTDDGGASWNPAASLDIENHDTSVAVLRLASGRLLLAANPGRGRAILQLFVSPDHGHTWHSAKIIEQDTTGALEYSYPSLLQTRDGQIHLSYTFRRQTIAHTTFDEAMLDEALLDEAPQ